MTGDPAFKPCPSRCRVHVAERSGVLSCHFAAGHPGEHRSGPWVWETAEELPRENTSEAL